MIAQKFLKFAYQLGKENRPKGQSAAQFVRQRLDALQLGQDLTRIALDPKHPRKISSETELLALRPELKQTE